MASDHLPDSALLKFKVHPSRPTQKDERRRKERREEGRDAKGGNKLELLRFCLTGGWCET
jgi:hypothetical protein